MFMCLSHKGTLDYLDALGEDYDVAVHKWRVDLEQNMAVQVHSIFDNKTKVYFILLSLLSLVVLRRRKTIVTGNLLLRWTLQQILLQP